MWDGRVKKYKDINPDDMSRLELYELLKQLNIPINMPDMLIRYRDPGGQFILIQSEEGVLEMFGLFREQPCICLYVGNLVNVGPQNQNIGQQEVDAAEPENLNIGAHVIEQKQVDPQIPEVEDPIIEQNKNINVRKEDQVINSSDSRSNSSYILDSDASTKTNSNFSFFLDGDTFSGGCDFNDEGDVNNGFEITLT
ncbi:hypothetical protein ACH5RR_025576 [Cinchona calisaya]|uniref:PB1 domain-containing protein n=1 Tax=Cinchona calisaya TaxID=153742 RepID=A0ABD2Z2F1_9GENT